MAAHELDPLDRLETLSRATEDLRPANDFTDAVMAAVENGSSSIVIEHARRQTQELCPTDDFVSAVMQRAGQDSGVRHRPQSDWNERVLRHSRSALFAAAAAAVFCVWLSSQAESRFDATILEDVAQLEVDE